VVTAISNLSKSWRYRPKRTGLACAVALFALTLALNSFTAIPKAHAASYEKLCLYYSQKYCIETEGIYNQVIISNTKPSYFSTTFVGSSGVMFQNESGLCLREDNALNGEVVTGAACSSGDSHDIWILGSSPGIEKYYNKAGGSNSWLLVNGPLFSGDLVYAANVYSGDWAAWIYDP
jgi:hypothetical protein